MPDEKKRQAEVEKIYGEEIAKNNALRANPNVSESMRKASRKGIDDWYRRETGKKPPK